MSDPLWIYDDGEVMRRQTVTRSSPTARGTRTCSISERRPKS